MGHVVRWSTRSSGGKQAVNPWPLGSQASVRESQRSNRDLIGRKGRKGGRKEASQTAIKLRPRYKLGLITSCIPMKFRKWQWGQSYPPATLGSFLLQMRPWRVQQAACLAGGRGSCDGGGNWALSQSSATSFRAVRRCFIWWLWQFCDGVFWSWIKDFILILDPDFIGNN